MITLTVNLQRRSLPRFLPTEDFTSDQTRTTMNTQSGLQLTSLSQQAFVTLVNPTSAPIACDDCEAPIAQDRHRPPRTSTSGRTVINHSPAKQNVSSTTTRTTGCLRTGRP